MIDLRTMNEQDIDAGLALCRGAGWNQLARDWEIFLKLGPNNCRVALIREKIAGTVSTIRYQEAFSWIGMVLVDPANRGRGIGTLLLKEALLILQHEQTVKLDATPAGRAVYLILNFVDEYPLSRMVCPAVHFVHQGSPAKPIQTKDLDRIKIFDQRIFGADRGPLLSWFYEGAPQYAYYIEMRNEIQGYCMGREGHHFTQLGPVLASDALIAQELVAAALKNCSGRPVGLDVFPVVEAWTAWLGSLGFTEQRPFMRMYKGKNLYPGNTTKQFAIAGPEYG